MENELDKCAVAEEGEAETAVPATERPKKKSLAWRILKWVLWSVAGLLAFVLVAALTLPLWISPIGTSLANVLVPKYTGTAFNVDRINLNPYTGKLLISGVKLANPEGYAEKDAFTLVSLSADVEVSTLLSDTIHVREITIDSPSASYVFDAEGVNNFDRIMEAVNEKLGPKKKKKKDTGETKVVIDKVTVKNVKVVVGNGRFELASLVLTDFGKDDKPAALVVSDVKLVNPPGFETENAFSLGSLSIGMETGDLGSLPIKIHDIVVDSPYASYVFDEQNVDNFTRMLEPLLAKGDKSGKKEKEEGKEKTESSGMPVTIDRLELKNLKAQICKGRFELASLEVTDFGKDDKPAALVVSDVKLVNPPGFEVENAFSLGSLSIGVETGNLGALPIEIHDIVIDSPYASYVFDEQNVDNFSCMLEPLLSKGDKSGKKEKEEGKEKTESSGMPVTIGRLELKNLKAQVCKGRFELASLEVTDFGKPTTAMIKLEDAKLVNPEGFPVPNAFTVNSINIGVETVDLSKKPMVFHDIIVNAPYVGFVYNDAGDGNFNVMFKSLQHSGKEEEKQGVASDAKKEEEKKDEGPRVQIDKLDITGTKLQYRRVTLPILLPTFNDIGKSSKDGATVKEVTKMVKEKVMNAIGSLSDFVDMLSGRATNLLGNATEKADELKDKAVEKADELKDKAVEKAGELKDKAVEKAGELKDKAADGVKAIKGLFGGDKKKDESESGK